MPVTMSMPMIAARRCRLPARRPLVDVLFVPCLLVVVVSPPYFQHEKKCMNDACGWAEGTHSET